MAAPELQPEMRSIGMPFSSSTSMTPIWAVARMKPPLSASPTFFRLRSWFIVAKYQVGKRFSRAVRQEFFYVTAQRFALAGISEKGLNCRRELRRGKLALVESQRGVVLDKLGRVGLLVAAAQGDKDRGFARRG